MHCRVNPRLARLPWTTAPTYDLLDSRNRHTVQHSLLNKTLCWVGRKKQIRSTFYLRKMLLGVPTTGHLDKLLHRQDKSPWPLPYTKPCNPLFHVVCNSWVRFLNERLNMPYPATASDYTGPVAKPQSPHSKPDAKRAGRSLVCLDRLFIQVRIP